MTSVTKIKDSTDSSVSYDQLVSNDNIDATEKPSDQPFKNLIVTYSEFTKNDRMRWRKVPKDPYIIYRASTKHTQILDDDYNGFKKDVRIPYDKDPIITDREYKQDDDMLWTSESSDNFDLNTEIKKQTEILENQYLAFAKFLRSSIDGRSKARRNTNSYKMKDPYSLYRDFKKQSQLRSGIYNREYEREIELQSEITYSALKRQIAIANDKESKDPHNLYKTLNRKFKKSYTEDFFRDPVAACIEVLEYISAWIAEKLSLPPPDPVDHDLVIYKREDKNNYSYLAAVIKNKKAQFLISRGVAFNDSESFGYMFLNQL